MKTYLNRPHALLAPLLFCPLIAFAATPADPSLPEENPTLEKFWRIADLYKDPSNHFIDEIHMTGRYQGDFFNVSPQTTPTSSTKIVAGQPVKVKQQYNNWETRRFRAGLEIWLFDHHLRLQGEADTNLDKSIVYNRMTTLNLRYELNGAFNITLGKMEPRFGYERMVSDRLQSFIERTFFDDQIGIDFTSTAEIDGKIGNWGYYVAAYSEDINKEWGQFRGGWAYQGEISYDFSKSLGSDKAKLVLDYLHSEINKKYSATFGHYNDAATLYFDYQKGAFGLVSQVAYANGVGNTALNKTNPKRGVAQFMVMPSYYITKNLQAEFRYSLGYSDSITGITELNRQDKLVSPKAVGHVINSEYLGLNYYINGDKLKLMTAIQYDDLAGGNGKGVGKGYKGFTYYAGVRMFF